MWLDFLAGFLGQAATHLPHGIDNKPSIGKKILPSKYKQNKTAIFAANAFIWIHIVVVIAAIVAWLS